jgi:hypothetical protein
MGHSIKPLYFVLAVVQSVMQSVRVPSRRRSRENSQAFFPPTPCTPGLWSWRRAILRHDQRILNHRGSLDIYELFL